MKKKIMGLLSVLILSFVCFQACNNSGKSSKQAADSINQANKTMAKSDADFMTSAAIGGMMEVKTGEVAQQKASNSRVKAFGAMMVRDHSQINSRLKALAADKNVALPDSLNESDQSDISDLSKKNGSDFDKSYMDEMVKDHKKDINEFERAANNVQDSDLKNFINQSLPILKTHLDSAQAIQNGLKRK